MTDPSPQLPLDYKMAIAEDFYTDDIVETIYLTDVFSVGPYLITLYNGTHVYIYLAFLIN